MMRMIWLASLFSIVLIAQQPSDPHDPAPWACSPTSKTHPCSCMRRDADPLCEGTIQEDATCKRYCTPAKCRCPIHCKES